MSVLDRLVVVILSNNMEHQYKTVIQEGCIEACLDLLENGTREHNISGLQPDNSGGTKTGFFNRHNAFLTRQSAFEQTKHHFTKFETIAMQAISLLFLDERSRKWPLTLSKRICRHSLRIIYKWSAKRTTVHSGRNRSFDSSTLLFTLSIIVKALRKVIYKRDVCKKSWLTFIFSR